MKSICFSIILYYISHGRELLVSQSQPEPTRPPIAGVYGQDCTPPTDDNPPDNCIEPGQTLLAPLGKIECEEDFDCCLCGTIKCGFSQSVDGNSIPCSEFHVNGDSGAFGVKNINIIGSASSGAIIKCGGDNACNGTSIYGLNIAAVECTGDSACAQSRWDLQCLVDNPCSVNCVGDDACGGVESFIIDNTAGLRCSDDACSNGVFVLESNIGGGYVSCDGESACSGAVITINNIDGIICSGVNACKHAMIRVVDPNQDFILKCTAMSACEGLDVEIFMNEWSLTDLFKGFNCGGFAACRDASVTLLNYGVAYLRIEKLECGAHESCKSASFDIVNGGFEHCMCGSASCVDTIGIESCFEGLDKLECVGIDSCQYTTQTLTNIANDFELICGSDASCQSMALTININDNKKDNPVTSLKGFKCNAHNSCNAARIDIYNTQTNDAIIIEKIECGGVYSCKNAVFGCNGDVKIKEIVCGDDGGCDECLVKMDNVQTVTCSSLA